MPRHSPNPPLTEPHDPSAAPNVACWLLASDGHSHPECASFCPNCPHLSGRRPLCLHQTLVTTHVLSLASTSLGTSGTGPQGRTQPDAPMFWKSPHVCATINSSSICQGPTGYCVPPSLHPGHAHQQEAPVRQEVGGCLQAPSMPALLPPKPRQVALPFPVSIPPVHNQDEDACPIRL